MTEDCYSDIAATGQEGSSPPSGGQDNPVGVGNWEANPPPRFRRGRNGGIARKVAPAVSRGSAMADRQAPCRDNLFGDGPRRQRRDRNCGRRGGVHWDYRTLVELVDDNDVHLVNLKGVIWGLARRDVALIEKDLRMTREKVIGLLFAN